MAVEVSPETDEPDRIEDASPTRARPTPPREPESVPRSEHDAASVVGASDLLVYGTDEILKGTDTATLVAFAALAYQQIKGKGAPHHNLGCILLLISVLACAIVHLSIGNAYVGRARMILKRHEPTRRQHLVRMASYGIAWAAAAVQFVSLLGGLLLILIEKPPAMLMKYIKPFLQV
jgi:hypothetical protein